MVDHVFDRGVDIFDFDVPQSPYYVHAIDWK